MQHVLEDTSQQLGSEKQRSGLQQLYDSPPFAYKLCPPPVANYLPQGIEVQLWEGVGSSSVLGSMPDAGKRLRLSGEPTGHFVFSLLVNECIINGIVFTPVV